MAYQKDISNMCTASCLICLDVGCSHCLPESTEDSTMYKQALQKARNIWYVKIKSTGELKKIHSNLYNYREGDDGVEFVANFSAPAVNGYVVLIEGDAPIYLSEAEFNRQYMEQQDG